MSEDEAIEILRDIPFFEQVENYDVNGQKWILKTNKRLAQARDMVLDLYKQEKEEKEELQEKLKEEMQIKNEYIDMLNATGKYSRIFKTDWEE